jgi:hypothetical protein
MQEVRVVTIDEEFEDLQKSRVKAHPSKTKTGKLTMVKEYSRAGEKKKKSFSIEDFSEKIGSAVELWGSEKEHKKIKNLVESGHKFKSVDNEKKVEKLKKEGWKEFAREENYDTVEYLIYKKKQ